jgi:hypothetical protein
MAITTNIKNYATAHGKGEGGGGGGTTIIMGNINNNDLPDDINVGSITAENGNIDYLNGKSLSYNDGGFIYISANDGTIAKLRGDEISYKDGVISRLKSDEITTGKLKADEAEIDKATINTINSKNITTEYLTVTKQAHFFELIVDKIRSVGGTTIQTAANCIIDWVKAYDSSDNEVALDANNVAYYNVYWRATEPSGRQITNDWRPFDQAICQSFNNVSAGVNYDISNKYYWRLVTALLPDTYMNINTGATTTQANAGVNSVRITNRTITYKDYQDQDQTLVNKFDIVAQTIPNVQTGASWNSSTETMTTTNTVFGIQLTPQSDLDNIVPTKFSFDCSSARLSIGIYYVDSTSQYFPAPDIAQTHYEYDLNADNNIEAIIITNADEVSWHLVHGITLSNTDKDANLSGSSSIPSKGDNIAQLGYRWNANGADANDKKRASAIIIAAYQTPDTGLTPPSYAQYQNITDYSLSSHRGTYMDANGSKFIGDFWIDNNTSITNYIDTHAPTYNLYTAYATSADYAQQRITSLTDSTGCQYMGMCSSPATTQPTNFSDYSWFAIQGSQGANGNTTVFVYKNASTQPSTPTGQGTPSGWSTTATTPPTGQYTWMSQSTINGSTGTYGSWSTPVRITGDDGQDGTDGQPGQNGANGKYMEFIYKRFATEQTFAQNNYNPAYWNASQSQDYLGPNGFEWSDNPEGITDVYKYEYMSQREYNGTAFGTFTTPVIWSKWGEKGMDGDGYEYIYKHFVNEPTWGQNNNNPAYWNASQDPEYLGPSGYQWSDDPVGVDETYLYEYVATRKRENGVWGKYSTPALWAHWSAPGSQGPAGPTGPQGPAGQDGQDGEDAIQYVLVNVSGATNSGAQVYAASDLSYKELQVHLRYKVVKIEGATATFMTKAQMDDIMYYPFCYIWTLDDGNPKQHYYKFVVNSDGLCTFDINNNLINNEFGFSQRAPQNIENNKALVVSIIHADTTSTKDIMNYNGPILDTQTLPVALAPTASFNIMQATNDNVARISSLVTGSTVIPSGATTSVYNQLSLLNQTATSISSTVQSQQTTINNLNGQVQQNTTNISQIQQTANSIQSTVSSMNAGAKNYFNFTYTNFTSYCWPYIQGYGLEGYGEQARSTNYNYFQVRNLDFGTNPISPSSTNIPKITMFVRCRMRMQAMSCNILVGLCNTQPNNEDIPVSGGRREVTVTTSWKEFTFTYEIPNDTDHFNGSNVNGHITFEGNRSTMTSSNRLYVDRLMISFGSPTIEAYNVSWRDYENSKITRYDALKIDDDSWNISNYLVVDYPNESHKGYPVKHINGGTSGTAYIDYISFTTSTLESNKHYTLSFYAKTTSNYQNYKFQAFMANAFEAPPENEPNYNSTTPIENLTVWPTKASASALNINTSQANICDGQTNFQLNTDWQKITIHWYKNTSGSITVIPLRALKQGTSSTWLAPDVYLAGVELREGWWDDNAIESNSLIAQSANEIELKVKNTGINIDDGTITLNASNTTINGNLNLYDTRGNGLTIYDNNNVERVNIQSDSIGDITSLPQDKYRTLTTSASRGLQSYSYTWTAGSQWFDANTFVVLGPFNLWMYKYNSTQNEYPGASQGSLRISIFSGSTELLSKTMTLYKADNWGNYTNQNEIIEYFNPTSRTLTVECYAYDFGTTSYGTIYFYPYIPMQWGNNLQTYIGRDGMYTHPSPNKFIWMNKDSLQLRYSGAGIKMSQYGKAVNDGRLEVMSTANTVNNVITPVWTSLFNYRPLMVYDADRIRKEFIKDGNNYYHQLTIDEIYGDIILTENGLGKMYFRLPVSGNLPTGYTFTIINNIPTNAAHYDVFVIPQSGGTIYDANRNGNTQINLNDNPDNYTFVYYGINDDWRVLADD